MRYARILSIGLVATVAFAWSAAAVEDAHELAGFCQSLERGVKGGGRHIYIPRTREALTCWGYMQGMQDLSVLANENERRIMGACPPEQMTTLQLIRLFVRYASTHRRRLILLLWPPMLIERFKLETLLRPATNEPPIL